MDAHGHRRRIGIEFISVLSMPPVEFVELTAGLGCAHIGLALAPFVANPHGYPAWSLRDDAKLRRDTAAALRDRGVSVALGEGFLVRSGTEIADSAADMDKMCELGAVRINAVSIDPDAGRALDQLAVFAEMAGARGLAATLEFMPGMQIGNLSTAIGVIRQVGNPDFRLLIDVMHVFRSGGSVADLAALDPELIGHLQLCDVPLVSKGGSYADEARHDRLPPGEGELPLLDALAALPRNLIVGLEVPMLEKARAGVGPRERMAACVEATDALLRRLDG